jgi:hypothetical protein
VDVFYLVILLYLLVLSPIILVFYNNGGLSAIVPEHVQGLKEPTASLFSPSS